MTSHGLVWFRKDLRLIDNPAWAAALDGCARITALFVLDPAIIDQTGPHRRAQLAAHLSALDEDLQAIGGHLWLLRGDPGELVPKAVEELGADALYANADAAPGSRRRDRRVFEALQDSPPERRPGDEPVPFHTFWGTLVLPPDSVTTKSGDEVSKVFTPFYKRWRDTDWDSWPTTDAHAGQPEFASTSSVLADHAIRLDDLPDVDEEPHHSGGARAALGRLGAATKSAARYSEVRDRPDLAATSELSVDLHFGTLSPRQAASALGDAEGGQALVRQLAWRDWYAHLLWEHPHLTDRAMRSEYDAIEWQNDEAEFEAWQRGDTGYPIVDAGMRQLEATGWVHNRVRMIIASFLVKDLLIDWRWGEAHFRRLLIDGDTTQNVGNWQWVAGTGPDAAPYFRIFNPTTQAEKFDPTGDYVRSWVPELGELPDKWIHDPSSAPDEVLAEAGVELGRDYPEPLVDHGAARERTLAAYEAARDDA